MFYALLAATTIAAASPSISLQLTEQSASAVAAVSGADQQKPVQTQGVPQHGILGIRYNPMVSELAEALGAGVDEGVFVQWVTGDGAAAKAGIRPGDVIVEADGKPIKSADAFSNVIKQSHPSQKTVVKIRRGKEILEISVTFEEFSTKGRDVYLVGDLGAPSITAPPPKPVTTQDVNLVRNLGALGLTMKREYAVQLRGVPLDVEGVILAQVDPASDLAKKGLMRGDIILSINFSPVRSVEELQGGLSEAKNSGKRRVLLRVMRRLQQPSFIPVLLPE